MDPKNTGLSSGFVLRYTLVSNYRVAHMQLHATGFVPYCFVNFLSRPKILFAILYVLKTHDLWRVFVLEIFSSDKKHSQLRNHSPESIAKPLVAAYLLAIAQIQCFINVLGDMFNVLEYALYVSLNLLNGSS